MHDRILILACNVDDLDSAVVRLGKCELFITVTVGRHIRSLDQGEHFHVSEIDELYRAQRFRNVKGVVDGMVIWHRYQVCAEIVTPERLAENSRLILWVLPVENQVVITVP